MTETCKRPSSNNSEIVDVVELGDRYVAVGNSRGVDYDFDGLSKGSIDAFVVEYAKDGTRGDIKTLGGTGEDYATKIVRLSGTKLAVALDTNSTDGDFEGMNRGDYDAAVVVFDCASAPDDPDVPTRPPRLR